MEQLFADDMQQEEAMQPEQTAAKQKAWIEKARSTLASLQGEKKIQAFFNFTPTVSPVSVCQDFGLTGLCAVLRQAQQHRSGPRTARQALSGHACR
jgi:hypothetical protein